MNRKKFIQDLLLISGSLIAYSCQNEELNLDDENSISIKEAQKWFTDTYLSTSRTSADDFLKRTSLWNMAKTLRTSNQSNYVVLPIGYKDKFNPSIYVGKKNDKTVKDKKKFQPEELSYIIERLMIFKNKKGENQARIVQFIPEDSNYDKVYKDKGNSRFSGYIFIKYWEGDLLEGYVVKNGNIEDYLTLDTPKNARLLYSETTEIVYVYVNSYLWNSWRDSMISDSLQQWHSLFNSTSYQNDQEQAGPVDSNSVISFEVSVDIDLTKVTNHCLRNIVNLLSNPNAKNRMAQNYINSLLKMVV